MNGPHKKNGQHSLPVDEIATRSSASIAQAVTLVDIGGYRLALHCAGRGNPVVVLDAGNNDTASTWSLVQPEIATVTHVCSYDRAGMGQSDPSPHARTCQQMVLELHALLERASIPGPYVLVGHSLGGMNVQLYASCYPSEVAGLVLVDPLADDLINRVKPLLTPAQFKEWAPLVTDASVNPEGWSLAGSEADIARVHAGQLPDVPVVVLSATELMPVMSDWNWPVEVVLMIQEQHAKILGRASRGHQIIVPESDHYIQRKQPTAVINAIREVVSVVRQAGK